MHNSFAQGLISISDNVDFSYFCYETIITFLSGHEGAERLILLTK